MQKRPQSGPGDEQRSVDEKLLRQLQLFAHAVLRAKVMCRYELRDFAEELKRMRIDLLRIVCTFPPTISDPDRDRL